MIAYKQLELGRQDSFCTLGIFISFYEVILVSQFLSNRLDDLVYRIRKLFSDPKKLRNLKRFPNLEVAAVSEGYNVILQLQRQMDAHFKQAPNFPSVILVFAFAYPALFIFEPTTDKKRLVNAVNYIFCSIIFSVIKYSSTKFMNSNRSLL